VRPLRRLALLLAGVLSVAALSGCGGGGTVDKGGFTLDDRNAASKVLSLLAKTSVYTAAMKMSLTQGAPPTDCLVHIQTRKPLTFRVFMAWVSQRPQSEVEAQARAYSWLDAVMSPEGLKDDYELRSGNETTEAALRAEYGDVASKPVNKCLVLQNQRFGFISSAGARRVG
jgi:hypothetical protein